MKNWRDVPHLFANGEFKLLWEGEILTIIEYKPNSKRCYWISDSYDAGYADIEHCQLIARKIEDMTDEEKQEYNELMNYDDYGCPFESIRSFLYALSVGCLPDLFKWDETVINVKTI